MTLVYYDIFAFLLLLGGGTLIEDKKRAVLTLLSLSLFLTAISAYIFFTSYFSLENEFVLDMGAMDLTGTPESTALGRKPYELYVSLFLIIWITFYCFSFLISRGVREVYFIFLKGNVLSFLKVK